MLFIFGQQAMAQEDPQPQADSATEAGYVSEATNSLDAMWDKANTEFVNGNFKGAIAEYNNIMTTGYTSADLHYNLANAYYKLGKMGDAILNYRRAYMLNPSDKDIKYNLEIAQAQTKDRIAEVPKLFISRFVVSVRSYFSSNEWANTAFALFTLAIVMFLIYLISTRNTVRKIGFICSVICCALFIFTLSFSVSQYRAIMLKNQAVVMSSAVAVRSSPDNSSKEIFILHEGTSIDILNTLGEWSEIVIADGNKGWMPNTAFEKISLAK